MEISSVARRSYDHRLKNSVALTLVRDAFNIFGLSIDWSRLPEGEAKQKLITAVDNCSTEIPLGLRLKEIGLSTSRFLRWIESGKLKPKKIGREYRISPEDLEKVAS